MAHEGFADKAKGTAEELAGKVSDHSKLKTEGKLDKAQGAVKDAAADLKDSAEAVGEKIKEVFTKDDK